MEKKTFWLFREFFSDGMALFETKKEAEIFREKIDKTLIQDLGEGLRQNEYNIEEVELNPDFETWYYMP